MLPTDIQHALHTQKKPLFTYDVTLCLVCIVSCYGSLFAALLGLAMTTLMIADYPS